MSPALRIGTRGSPLARWQANWVAERLGQKPSGSSLVEIRTAGDVEVTRPVHSFGSPAVFSKELDEAVLDGRVDIAVHSLKDLPTTITEGLTLVAVGEKEDPRDALVARSRHGWSDLPQGSTIATSSLRRRAQLLRARPDVVVVEIRGNVETRLEKLDRNPHWSATVLAVAGLTRLGLATRIGERLSTRVMLPAPGQGAIAVTARTDDPTTRDKVRSAVHDEETGRCVTAERAFLGRLEGGCQVPVGALGVWIRDGGRLRLTGRIVSLDGSRTVEGTEEGRVVSEDQATLLGHTLADRLLGSGGAEILDAIRAPRS